MPCAILQMAAKAMVHIGLGAEIVGIHRSVIEVTKAVLGLHRNVHGKGFAIFHAPFEHLEIRIVPIAAVGAAETVAVVGPAAREFDHPTSTIIVVHVSDGGPGRIAVINVPAGNQSVFGIFVCSRGGRDG